MTILVLFIKNLLVEWKNLIFDRMNLSKVQAENPSCQFYLGSKIHNVSFGNHVVIFENVYLENCKIGAYSYVQKNSKIFNSEIGNFCSIASGVSVGPGQHNTKRVSMHPSFFDKETPLPVVFAETIEDLNSIKKTKIFDDVWVGERAILIDGVVIGTGAVIAAGAVVTRDVAPYTIVGGTPAKEIRKRFSDEEIELLLASKWWLKSNSWLKENYVHFKDVNSFLELIKASND